MNNTDTWKIIKEIDERIDIAKRDKVDNSIIESYMESDVLFRLKDGRFS